MTPVYCALIEIKPLDGCELDPSNIAGAVVRCYIPAEDEARAIDMLQIQLSAMRMELIATEWCVSFNEAEWEHPQSETDDGYVADARDTGEIVFDDFHVWSHDDPDVA